MLSRHNFDCVSHFKLFSVFIMWIQYMVKYSRRTAVCSERRRICDGDVYFSGV